MAYKAKVDVTLKKSVLDPQGQTVLQALHTMGHEGVEALRVGKHFEVTLQASDQSKAESELKAMCDQVLTNPIIEQYTFKLEEV